VRAGAPALHAVTWLVWAIAASATVQLASSPVYVALVIGAALVVVSAHGRDTALSAAFPLLLAAGAAFALLRVVLTAATTHGMGAVWLTLPSATLPRIFGGFTVGGTVEAPVVLGAGAEGFAVVGIVAAFAAFNAVVSHAELVETAPRAFHEPGLVVTVALAFVPSTIAAARAVREADRARTGGRVVRRGRLLRQLVPLLESGMERSVSLAESMDARGFAHHAAGPGERAAGWAGTACLLALGGGFVALVGGAERLALALGALGLGALVVAVAMASRASGRARYRPRHLTGTDAAAMATVAVAPLAVVLLGALGDDTLRWSPYPLHLPGVSPLACAAVLLLVAPAVVPPTGPAPRGPGRPAGERPLAGSGAGR
jgi:energy-coupling factor transport system permease protein